MQSGPGGGGKRSGRKRARQQQSLELLKLLIIGANHSLRQGTVIDLMEDRAAKQNGFEASFEPKQPFPPLLDELASPEEVQESYAEDESVTSPGYDEIEVEDDADFQSHYSLEPQFFSDSESEDSADDIGRHHPFRQSTGSLHGPNAFAPPFYNRPPTPLPPSPSLTSLLRPPFSTTTSRPTTPDSSDVETPNDTEAAVAKSARRATTVPRASPKVPTYEYYGFVLYLASSLAFCTSLTLCRTSIDACSACQCRL